MGRQVDHMLSSQTEPMAFALRRRQLLMVNENRALSTQTEKRIPVAVQYILLAFLGFVVCALILSVVCLHVKLRAARSVSGDAPQALPHEALASDAQTGTAQELKPSTTVTATANAGCGSPRLCSLPRWRRLSAFILVESRRGILDDESSIEVPSRPNDDRRQQRIAQLPSSQEATDYAQLVILLAITMSDSVVSTVIFPFVPCAHRLYHHPSRVLFVGGTLNQNVQPIASSSKWAADFEVDHANAVVAILLMTSSVHMVSNFGVASQDVGYYAGMLSSAYNLSQMFASVFWGRCSDVFGRKPVLMFGITCSACSTVVFGLCTSFEQAMVVRFGAGLLSSNSAVARAAMRSITAEADRTRCFSLMGVAYGVGFFVGSSIGGVLSRPGDVLPTLLAGTFIGEYPYLLPCLVSTVGAVFALVLMAASMGIATDALQTSTVDADAERSPTLASARNGAALPRGSSSASARADAALLEDGAACVDRARSLTGNVGVQAPPTGPRAAAMVVFTDRGLASCIAAQFGLNVALIGLEEAFSLFCASDDGLHLPASDLSASLTPIGLSLLLCPFAYPAIERRIGSPACFQCGVCFLLAAAFFTPALRALRGSSVPFWTGLIAIAMLRGIAGVATTTAIALILNQNIYNNFGLVNGLASSASSLARTLTPGLIGSIYAAATASNRPYPLNVFAPFYLLSCVCAVTLIISFGFHNPSQTGIKRRRRGRRKRSRRADSSM